MMETLTEIQALAAAGAANIHRTPYYEEIPNGALFYASDKGNTIFQKDADYSWTMDEEMNEDDSVLAIEAFRATELFYVLMDSLEMP